MKIGMILADMYNRALDLRDIVRHKSIFLLGPRQTGKSTLVRQAFPDASMYDLLEADTFRELSARPETIRQTLSPRQRVLIVDEIQKLPALLNEVQLLIDRNKALRVILTGSSARKLWRGGANLLGGRAWTCRLHPLVSAELPAGRLMDRLNRGSLPAIIDSPLYCTAKSMIVVVPPKAAARVPVKKSSDDCVPPNGNSMCVCGSMPPGITSFPAASIVWSASISSLFPMMDTRSSSIRISAL